MKRISSIKQLQTEKERIGQHKGLLEKKIADNWDELKISMKPASLVKYVFGSLINKTEKESSNNGGKLKSVFSFAAAILAKRIADKTGRKLSRLYRKND